MFNLVYWSNAARSFTDDELFEMLSHWREKNIRLGITGLLLYKEGAFIQSLEGEEAVVRALYASISQDERHFQVVIIQSKPVESRQFPDWSMGFKNLTGVIVDEFPGYNPHPTLSPPSDETLARGTVAMHLLASFAK